MTNETVVVIRHLNKKDAQKIEHAINELEKEGHVKYACICSYNNINNSLKTIEID